MRKKGRGTLKEVVWKGKIYIGEKDEEKWAN